MAKAPNMKIGIGADTSDFEKGAKQVKQGLKDLSKTGEQSLSALGEAFGVNTGKVGQMTSAIRGLGAKMTEASNTGVQGFGKLLASITPLGGAIAGLGLAAAIAGFKQLKSEAENFKSTIDGLNLSMGTAAYIQTYKQALHDVNSETGRSVAEAMSDVEKGWGRFTSNLGATLAMSLGQNQKWYDAFTPSGIIRAWGTVKKGIDDATAAAERNEARASQLADIQKEELQVRREVADIEVKIAEQRRILRDRSASVAERTAAEAETRRLINERTEKQTDIAQRLYEITQAMTDETGSTYEEVARCVSLYEQWQGRIAATENEMAGVDRYANSIAGSTSKTAAALQKQREEFEKIAAYAQKRIDMNTTASIVSGGGTAITTGVTGPEMSILLHPKIDEKEAIDISRELASLIEQGAVSVSESIGNLIGDLVTGGDAWKNFTNGAISAFGDMAISVGKMAIATGVATLGIKEALESLNGYVAIAAGAALVALGSAVKTGLANIAGGDYSAAGGGYSSGLSYGSAGGGYETREVTVNVTGTLEADGDKLITVLNNTNRKNYYTR